MDTTLAILDVREKEAGSEARPPSFPTPKPSGFPEHKKRTRVSAFKRQKQREQPAPGSSSEFDSSQQSSCSRSQVQDESTNEQDKDRPHFDSERRRIDKENRERLAAMSADDIAQARKEIFELDPSLIQLLLRRANLDEKPPGPDPFSNDSPVNLESTKPEGSAPAPTRTVVTPSSNPETDDHVEAQGSGIPKEKRQPAKKVSFAATVEDDTNTAYPLRRTEAPDEPEPTNTTHFPRPADTPDLDPSDPNFLETLHSKYFPNLPADPARLAWMSPVPTEDSPADRESPYYPGQTSLAVSQLRFDFQGRLLPPRISRQIPVSLGLHHHGEAPEAAGYTIGELARLARSAVPAQRCIAFRTLGRILFRLGTGEWGSGEGTMGMGIFRCVSEGRVLDSLKEAAAVEDGRGHRSSKAYAIEALWLYEKGGWVKSFKGR